MTKSSLYAQGEPVALAVAVAVVVTSGVVAGCVCSSVASGSVFSLVVLRGALLVRSVVNVGAEEGAVGVLRLGK